MPAQPFFVAGDAAEHQHDRLGGQFLAENRGGSLCGGGDDGVLLLVLGISGIGIGIGFGGWRLGESGRRAAMGSQLGGLLTMLGQ